MYHTSLRGVSGKYLREQSAGKNTDIKVCLQGYGYRAGKHSEAHSSLLAPLAHKGAMLLLCHNWPWLCCSISDAVKAMFNLTQAGIHYW